jgi:hypothetical protein
VLSVSNMASEPEASQSGIGSLTYLCV